METKSETADTSAVREPAKVETAATLLESLTNAEPASKAEDVKEDEKSKSKKQTAQERIIELAHKRREAEKSADDAKRENEELRQRLRALEQSAPAVKQDNKPQRSDFGTDDQYIEALTDWKAIKAVADREEQQRQARLAAEMQDIDSRFSLAVKAAVGRYEDFAEVVSGNQTVIPDFVVMAIKESSLGGDITYYLAKHDEEARKLAAMRPVQAIKYLDRLERDLAAKDDEPAVEKKPVSETQSQTKRKAPEPITPVRGSAVLSSSGSSDFEEYRARRRAELKR